MTDEPVTLKRVPVRMFLPPDCQRVTPRIRREREWEPSSTQWILDSIRRGDVFVDVGAHAGYFTLIVATLVGPLGHVYAFEPDPTNCAILLRNVKLNGLTNVTVEQRAVVEESGRKILYLNRKNTGDHRLSPVSDAETVEVDGISLDDYFKARPSPVDLVKVDTQGAEMGVLAGMWRILALNRRIRMLLEFWPYGLGQFGHNAEGLLGVLNAHGFAYSPKVDALARCTVTNRKHVNLRLMRGGFEVPA